MTQFEIEAAIQQWKRTLLASGSLRAEDVDELEDHLREAHASLRAAESPATPLLDDEECFVIATRRLGRPDVLAREFDKADTRAVWRRRWILMLAGYAVITLVFSLINSAAHVVASMLSLPLGTSYTLLYSASLLVGFAVASVLARNWSKHATSTSSVEERALSWLRTPILVAVALAVSTIKVGAPLLTTWLLNQRIARGELTRPIFLVFPQAAFWLAPVILLVLLVRHERKLLLDEAA